MGGTVLISGAAGDTTIAQNAQIFEGSGKAPVLVIRGEDFESAAVTLYMRSTEDAGGRWFVMTDGVYTAETQKTLDPIPSGIQIAATITGTTTAVDNIFVAIHS